jgi:hypothetical protein
MKKPEEKPGWKPTPDTPMSETELKHAETMMRCGEIINSDLAWLMGLEDMQEDRPPPRGFKSWEHFHAMLWYKEQRAKFGRPVKRRKRAA